MKRFGIEVYTFDYSKDLNPDICADIRDIKNAVGNRKFDYVLCCQVLEHREYKHFTSILKQLKSIMNEKLIISLPQQVYKIEFKSSIPKFPSINIKLIFAKFWLKSANSHVHYWEIGIKNYPIKKIRKDIKNYFVIEKEYTDSLTIHQRSFVLK